MTWLWVMLGGTLFLPTLDGMMGSGLVTLEKVQVLPYGAPR
jgi:hypothetical protein